jgi:hypothetical protein
VYPIMCLRGPNGGRLLFSRTDLGSFSKHAQYIAIRSELAACSSRLIVTEVAVISKHLLKFYIAVLQKSPRDITAPALLTELMTEMGGSGTA